MSLPLALIHGWGQHGGAWRQLLADMNVSAACNFELPGHGDAAPASFDLDALADAYALRAPAECGVMAWSLGAQIALRWAQLHPQQVRKLVLFSATPCFGERADWPHGSPAEIQQVFFEQVAAAPETALQRFADLLAVGEADLRGARRAVRALLTEQPTPDTAMLLDGLKFLSGTDLRASLQTSPPAQPVLLIHGENDTITPFGASRWLATALPKARLHALPHCGHAPLISQAAAVGTVIKAFLDE